MAQRYQSPVALERMAANLCPECGEPADAHSPNPLFWQRDPLGCSLLPEGVRDRIAQAAADREREESRA